MVTDSACDLPPTLVADHGIEIVPLTIRFGDEELFDRDLSPTEFWDRCSRSALLPETAAPSPGAFQSAFERAADDGCAGVVCITLSSELSGTFQAAQAGAKEMSGRLPVRVIDSRSVTMAQGLMALSAARMGGEGKGFDDVAGAAEDLIPRTRIFATLDTLDNLKKGGRIGGAQALIGSLLSIKPVVEVRDGKVEVESRQRTRVRSLQYLVDKVRQFGAVENLAVMHGNAPDLEQFLDMIADVYPRERIIVGDLGAVIATHAGPRAIGVTFHVPA